MTNSDSLCLRFSEDDEEGGKFAVHTLKASGAFWYLYGPATIKLTCSEDCVYMAKWVHGYAPFIKEGIIAWKG